MTDDSTRAPAPAAAGDDDERWLAVLAGRDAAGTDPATRAEAAALREGLRRWPVAPPPGAPRAPELRIAALLARAQEAGVLEPRSAPPQARAMTPARSWWRPAGSRLALAAGFAGIVGAVVLRLMPAPPADADAPPAPGAAGRSSATEGTLRGTGQQTLVVDDPAATQVRLLQALHAAGFEASPYEQLGRPALDIALPVPLSADQAAALRRLGLAAPGGPSLRVELLPTPAGAAKAAAGGSAAVEGVASAAKSGR